MPRTAKNSMVRRLYLLVAVVLSVLFLWWLESAFDDRHWREFSEAGTRALQRGNYDWAEKMYRESLQYAQGQNDEDRIVQSYLLLQRLYKTQGREDLAEQMLARAREARQGDRD